MDFLSLLLSYGALAFVLGGGLILVVVLFGIAVAGSLLAGAFRFRKIAWLKWAVLFAVAWCGFFIWLG